MTRRKERTDSDGRCYLPSLEEIELMKRMIREANERGEGKRVYKLRDAELREVTGLERN